MKHFLIIVFLSVCTTACANMEIVPKSSGRNVRDCFEKVEKHNIPKDVVQQFCKNYPYGGGHVIKNEELMVMKPILDRGACHLTATGVNAFCERFNCGGGCLAKR